MRTDAAYVSLLALSFVPAAYVAAVRTKQRKRNWSRFALVAFFAAALYTFLIVFHLSYLHRLTFPSHISFPVATQQIKMEQPSDSGFYLFNPSLARYRGEFVVAIREGNLNNCPEFTSWYDLRRFRRLDSRVLLTRANTVDALSRPLKLSQTIENRDAKAFYHGVDDPRIVVSVDDRLYATVAQNNHLFVSTLGDDLSEKSRVKVEPQWAGAFPKQKNWMYLPVQPTVQGRLAFVQWLNPLAIAELEPSTGKAWITHEANKTAGLPGHLRGSTNFLPHPHIEGRFFAIAHEKEELYPPIIISFFRSRVVEIGRSADGKSWDVTGVSEQFSIPSGTERGRVHRIHYPTSMEFEREGDKSSLLIGMGFMDCTAHVVRVETDDLIAMVKPVSASQAASSR